MLTKRGVELQSVYILYFPWYCWGREGGTKVNRTEQNKVRTVWKVACSHLVVLSCIPIPSIHGRRTRTSSKEQNHHLIHHLSHKISQQNKDIKRRGEPLSYTHSPASKFVLCLVLSAAPLLVFYVQAIFLSLACTPSLPQIRHTHKHSTPCMCS